MVNGTDSEVRCLGGRSPKSQDSYPGSPRLFNSPTHKATGSQAYQSGMYYSKLFVKSLYSQHAYFQNLLRWLCILIRFGETSSWCSPSPGFDSNCCNGVSSSKAHSSAHSHKPCPVTTGSGELGVLNGSRTQQSSIRYSSVMPHTLSVPWSITFEI